MNKHIYIYGILILFSTIFSSSCYRSCRGGEEILDFLTIDPQKANFYEKVCIEWGKQSIEFKTPSEIQKFRIAFYHSYDQASSKKEKYHSPYNGKKFGKIVLHKKGDSRASCFIIFKAKYDKNLYLLRMNDSTRGGGTMFFFEGLIEAANRIDRANRSEK